MRIQIEADAGLVKAWLDSHKYPCDWTLETLRDQTMKVAVTEGEYVHAFVWATWHPDLAYTLDFHACAAPRSRGRWLTDEVVADLEKLAGFLGANALITTSVGEREARLIPALLTRRHGFSKIADGICYKRIN